MYSVRFLRFVDVITVMSREFHGVSNHQNHCFFNYLFMCIKENTKAVFYWPFVKGIHRLPVDFPHKGPETRNDVIMFLYFDTDKFYLHSLHWLSGCMVASMWEEQPSLQWRHNGHNGASNHTNHQPHHYLLNRLLKYRSKKTSKLRVTGLCAGNSTVTGEFPTHRASNTEYIPIWWRHHLNNMGKWIPLFDQMVHMWYNPNKTTKNNIMHFMGYMEHCIQYVHIIYISSLAAWPIWDPNTLWNSIQAHLYTPYP